MSATKPHRPTRGIHTPLPPHGTPARGTGRPGQGIPGCKCQPCRSAKVKADALRALANLSGRPVRVPTAPAAAHLRALLGAGMGWPRITRAAHCSTCTISRLLNGQELVRRSVSDRILAVKYRPAPGRIVEAVGTLRRIQALMAIGHTRAGIGEEADVDASVITDILGGAPNVRGMTADRIAGAYDWLAHQPPATSRESASTASRNRAARQGWRDPQWWEDMGDIDDAAFDPDVADRAPGRNELGAARRAEVEHLASFGLSIDEIDKRVDLAESSIRAIVRELQTGRRRDRSAQAA